MTENAHVTREISLKLQSIARVIDRDLKTVAPGIAFSLFVWSPGISSYISNSKQREDIIQAIEKIITRWKQGDTGYPGA